MQKNRIESLLERHGKEVASFEIEEARRFLTLFRELKDRITARLFAVDPDRRIDVFRMRAVMAETEDAIRILEQKAGVRFGQSMTTAAGLARDHAVDEIRTLSRELGAEPLDVSLSAARVLGDPVRGLLANGFQTSVQRYGLDVLQTVQREMFFGLRLGENYKQVARRLTAPKGALEGRVQSDAIRLVRTETSQAYNVANAGAQAEAKKELPDLKKVWWKSSSYKCDICQPLHGTERETDGTWTVFEGTKHERKVLVPPGHPNCACRSIASRPRWKSAMAKAGLLSESGDVDLEAVG